jgi:hypothetical protein
MPRLHDNLKGMNEWPHSDVPRQESAESSPLQKWREQIGKMVTIDELEDVKAELKDAFGGRDLGPVLEEYQTKMHSIGNKAVQLFAIEMKDAKTLEEIDSARARAKAFFGDDITLFAEQDNMLDARFGQEIERIEGGE